MRRALPDSIARRLDPTERYGLRLTLAVVAMLLVVVPFSTLVFQVVGRGPLTRFDGEVADALNDDVSRSPLAVDLLQAISWVGRPLPMAALVVAAAVYARRRGRRRLSRFLVATTAAGGLLNTAVKALVDRPRPVVDHPVAGAFGSSFPSGHAMGATVVFGALLLALLPVVPRRGRFVAVTAAAAMVIAIGGSRVLLGVHFISDVVGGYVLGLAWLAASAAVFAVWRAEEGRPAPASVLEEGIEPEAGPALRGRA